MHWHGAAPTNSDGAQGWRRYCNTKMVQCSSWCRSVMVTVARGVAQLRFGSRFFSAGTHGGGLRGRCCRDEASRRGSACLLSPMSFRHRGWWWQPQGARLPARSIVAAVMECEARVSALWERWKMMMWHHFIDSHACARIMPTWLLLVGQLN